MLARRVRLRDSLELAFMQDPASGAEQVAWQRDARQQVEADLPAGSSLRSFDCHASFCRIETGHTGMRQYHEYLQAAFSDPKTSVGTHQFYSTPATDDRRAGETLVTVAYVAEPGQSLRPFSEDAFRCVGDQRPCGAPRTG